MSGVLSICVVALVAGAFATYNLMSGQPLAIVSTTPKWLMVCLALIAVGAPMSMTYFLAKYFTQSLAELNAYLRGARYDLPTGIRVRSFAELRMLRAGLTRTIGKLRRETEALRLRAFYDPVTGLPNENALMDNIEQHLRTSSFEQPAAMMFLEIDAFGRTLEQIGSVNEPDLVKQIAERLSGAVNAVSIKNEMIGVGVMVAALQSDEFAVFLPNAGNRKDVAAVARAVRIAFARPFQIQGSDVRSGISGGIIMAPEDADSSAKMLRFSQLALRLLRKDGKTGFQFYSPNMNRQERGRLVLENELREAVANKEFKVVFQPKVDFATGKIIGAEALARWRRPTGKIVSPAAFIPLAEETGLIAEIGEQVLDQACRAGRLWMQEGFDVNIAVNVSPRQFESSDLTDTVLKTLSRTGLPPSRLELEITESMAVSDPERVAQVMRPLRAMGMRLAIDDFGTGHSNLSMLTQLPFDVFKIDRQFVSALMGDQHAPAIVEMILAMAETLGLKTVAEGIETSHQADFLRRRGCTLGQGFLYSPGLPHKAFLDLLRSWQSAGAEADDYTQPALNVI